MEALDMRSLVMALACFFLFAPTATAQSACTPFQLVGFTAATFAGGTGTLAFTLACQQEFALSRMCTSEEIVNTQTVPTSLSGPAWVRPTFRAVSAGSSTVALDESGVTDSPVDALSCQGWTDNTSNSRGLSVEADGSFESNEACDEVLHVACCAPVPIAVPEPSAMLLQGSGIAGLLALAKLSDSSQ
jgi:hypothetical protein